MQWGSKQYVDMTRKCHNEGLHFVCLILYVPVNIFSVMSGRVFMCITSAKQGLMCLAQGHNAVRLKPAAPRSQVQHSTTEPLRSLEVIDHWMRNALAQLVDR